MNNHTSHYTTLHTTHYTTLYSTVYITVNNKVFNRVYIIKLSTVCNEVYKISYSKGVQYNVHQGVKESVPLVLGQFRQILVSRCRI